MSEVSRQTDNLTARVNQGAVRETRLLHGAANSLRIKDRGRKLSVQYSWMALCDGMTTPEAPAAAGKHAHTAIRLRAHEPPAASPARSDHSVWLDVDQRVGQQAFDCTKAEPVLLSQLESRRHDYILRGDDSAAQNMHMVCSMPNTLDAGRTLPLAGCAPGQGAR